MNNQQFYPLENVTEFIKNINVKYKLAFLSCFIFSIFSQSFGLFNKLSFHDDIVSLFDVGATYTSGRWGLEILKQIIIFIFGGTNYSLPVFNGFISIIFLALTSCIIIDLINIKNQIINIFISGILVCFPVITSFFGYMYTLPFYTLSILISTLGVYLICKKSKTHMYLLGTLLITFSISIYQAFLPFTLSLFVLYLINSITNENISNKCIFKKLLLIFISVVSSVILYLAVTKLYLIYYKAELSTYREINTLGITSFSGYLNRIIFAYKEFFLPTSSAQYYMYPLTTIYIYYICIVLSIIMMCCWLIKLYKQSKTRATLLAISFISIPFTTNFIFIISPTHFVHSLMVYSQLVPFIFFAWLLENTNISYKKFEKNVKSIIYTILILLNVMYIRYDNVCYLKAIFSQQQLISYYTTLITQIKSIDNYADNLPIVFVNEQRMRDITLQAIPELNHIKGFPYKSINFLVNSYTSEDFMRRWLAFSPKIVKNSAIKNSKQVKDMPSYPDKGSIQVLHNHIVVKF